MADVTEKELQTARNNVARLEADARRAEHEDRRALAEKGRVHDLAKLKAREADLKADAVARGGSSPAPAPTPAPATSNSGGSSSASGSSSSSSNDN